MKRNELQPIHHESALLLREKHLLVIADLHIGIETELRDSGLHIPSQTPSMEKRLLGLMKKYAIQEIILLGDIKHNIPTSPVVERKDVDRFFSLLQSVQTIHVVPGNHDGTIYRFLPSNAMLHPSDGFIYKNIGFVHGHRWPREDLMQCHQLVIGHTHPTIMLTDRLGHKTFEPCWVRAQCLEDVLEKRYPSSSNPDIVILPAFNPLCGGNPVNQGSLLGPFKTLLDLPNAEAYLLDGTLLGKIKDIR